MNVNYRIANKSFTLYPYISGKTWTSAKIFLLLTAFSLAVYNTMHFWNYPYPSSVMRGGRPQYAHSRPLIVYPYRFHSGTLKTERELELYTLAQVDDYTFKSQVFANNKAF